MIPGTKARARPGEKKLEKETPPSAEEISHEQQKSLEKIMEPSARHYSRRALLAQAPAFFGEGLRKLLRASNHLERKISGDEKISAKK